MGGTKISAREPASLPGAAVPPAEGQPGSKARGRLLAYRPHDLDHSEPQSLTSCFPTSCDASGTVLGIKDSE